MEVNSKDSRAALEATKLDENELVLTLDYERLHTNVPVDEAIEIAFKELYSSEEVPVNSNEELTQASRTESSL